MKRWLPTILALAFVAWMIALADLGYAIEFFATARKWGGDKLGHFGLMGGLALCVNVSLDCRKWRRWLLGSIFVAVGCTLEELSQIWNEHRHCDPLDLAADFAGIWFAGWIARRICARRSQA